MSFLALTGIRKTFGAHAVVRDFNLAVERGEFVTFLGPSGCGKTTTLRMVAGFEAPTAGEIRINGQDVTHLRANKRAIGMVFQSYALFPNMTVAANIGFGLKVARRPADALKARVDEMLAMIKLPQLAERYPYQLSGGQQQRVSLARALAPSPQILLLDEPLSALDARIRVALREEIRALQRKLGITTIFVTHDQEEALSMSDRIVVMNDGAIEQVGLAERDLQRAALPLRRFVRRHAQPARRPDRRRVVGRDRHRRPARDDGAQTQRRETRRHSADGAQARGAAHRSAAATTATRSPASSRTSPFSARSCGSGCGWPRPPSSSTRSTPAPTTFRRSARRSPSISAATT